MLSDSLQRALARVGITEARLKEVTGFDCGCEARKGRMDAAEVWAKATAGMAADRALSMFKEVFSDRMRGEDVGQARQASHHARS